MNYEMNSIYRRDAKTVLKEIESSSFDLVVTTPPAYEYDKVRTPWDNRYEYLWADVETYISDMKQVFGEVFRVMKNHRYCIIVTGDVKEKVGKGDWQVRTVPLPAYFIKLCEDIGFTYITEYIWDKGEPGGVNRKKGPYYPFRFNSFNCCQHVLVFAKHVLDTEPAPCPVCGKTEVMQAGYSGIGIKRWMCRNPNCAAKQTRDTGKLYTKVSLMFDAISTNENRIPDEMENKYRRNMIYAEPLSTYAERNTTKPTMLLPMEIAELAVRFFSGVGDKVLDPYMGSGMTAAAADKYGREFLGFMYDDRCYERARKVVGEIESRRRIEAIRQSKENKKADLG